MRIPQNLLEKEIGKYFDELSTDTTMILLDTHVLIWWVNDSDKLSTKVSTRIEKEIKSGRLLVSSISVWEIYLLIKKAKLKLHTDTDTWLETIQRLGFIEFVPIDNSIAAKSVDLPGRLHNDPADRIIIATAREYGATLVTSDKRILAYPHVQSLW